MDASRPRPSRPKCRTISRTARTLVFEERTSVDDLVVGRRNSDAEEVSSCARLGLPLLPSSVFGCRTFRMDSMCLF